MKNVNISDELPKKGGRAWTVCRFKRGAGKKRGGDALMNMGVGLIPPTHNIWIGGDFLLTLWFTGIKYSKKITLCDTNTVILIINYDYTVIVIANKCLYNWHIVSAYLSPTKLSGITNPKAFQLVTW